MTARRYRRRHTIAIELTDAIAIVAGAHPRPRFITQSC
ncbi:Hypothetical protein A7982_00421 [Minicystis rosea]|nr:Hypothetical protein A7982_00421 [Minicystis rosea]